MANGKLFKEIVKFYNKMCIRITIWQVITIQLVYYLDMGYITVMYYKCSYVPNLVIVYRALKLTGRFNHATSRYITYWVRAFCHAILTCEVMVLRTDNINTVRSVVVEPNNWVIYLHITCTLRRGKHWCLS